MALIVLKALSDLYYERKIFTVHRFCIQLVMGLCFTGKVSGKVSGLAQHFK